MKKLLLYSSVVLMLAASLMMGMLSGQEVLMLMTSSILLAMVTILVLTVMDRQYIWYIPCYILVIITHAMFVFSSTSIAMTVIYILGIVYCVCAFCLYLAWRKNVSAMTLLSLSLLMKVCLIPEGLLNIMLFSATGQSDFLVFSFMLMVLTSAYGWVGIWQDYKNGILAKLPAVASGLLDLVFPADLAATGFVWYRTLKFIPEAVPESIPAFKTSQSFRSGQKKGRAVRPDFSQTSKKQSSDPQ